jgi:4-amino-4-deoxy-L-arabinose transferase-like glycosyltransferase
MVSSKPLQSLYNGVIKHSKSIVIVLLCLACIAVVIYHRLTLTQFPPVLIDEPWYANTAWNWLINGKNFDTMHAGARDSAMWPYLGNFPLLVSFKFFGLGLLQARMVSWVFGTLLLLATALVGRKLYGTLTGVLSALLLSISNPYLWSSHYYRPDVMLLSISMFCFCSSSSPWIRKVVGTFSGRSPD